METLPILSFSIGFIGIMYYDSSAKKRREARAMRRQFSCCYPGEYAENISDDKFLLYSSFIGGGL